ncbi:integrase, catalytic region, zinc finger, CCHC-type containing protein [Tanacetum coccineum]
MAEKAQPALYDGDELLKPHHVPVIVPASEEELELAETTRNKLHVKMNDSTCVEKRVNITPPNYSKENFMATFTPQTQLTPEQVFWSLDLAKRKAEELKANAPPLPVLPPATVYPPNTPVHMVPRTLLTTSQVNIGLYVITQLFWDFEIERKNLLITNENLLAECLSKDVFYIATDSVLNVSRFSDMHDAFTIAQKRIADLESENFNLRNKIQNDDHDSMIKHFSKLEVEHFNLQLKYQNLKERFGNKKPMTSSYAPSFDLLFCDADPTLDLKALVSQNKDLTAKLNALHDLNERFRAENAKVKHHYKELYPIDVEPIPPRLKKNREVHLHYIKHLKENVETLREIVEEAKVKRPLDTSLASACRYTKHSQELLEYVIGTCPKDFSPRDKQNASTNSLRKKRVTFVEPCETSTHNTPPQVEHQKINSTNAPGIPSTGVKGASAASRSKPRSNTKKDRTLPAKSALKQVEAHSRMNKSNEKQKNRVDSSISYKRTVINSNSNTSCKTCNKCLISVNHDQCVVRSEMFVKQSPATKVWRVKQVKQVWKATGKLFTTIGHQWRPTGRLLPLGDQWPITRNTPPKVLPTKQWKPTDLEVASKAHIFVRDLEVFYLIKEFLVTNLYTISVEDMMRSSPICLLSKASKNKSWLWHRRLNHLNFGTLNDLARKDLVRGLPRLKFEKDHLCSACQLGKSRKATHKPKTINTITEVLHTLHMDLCRPLRVQSINGKKYILVIVDDYSVFTWGEVFKITRMRLPAFNTYNKDLTDYYESVGITHEKTVLRTPQQNGVVERRNRTLVEAARTMLIFSKAPLFLWAEAVATACYTQN